MDFEIEIENLESKLQEHKSDLCTKVICTKCDDPNELDDDVCRFCGSSLHKYGKNLDNNNNYNDIGIDEEDDLNGSSLDDCSRIFYPYSRLAFSCGFSCTWRWSIS